MKNYITMRRLGTHGRWANQLFQYMFLRCYGREFNLTVQVPPWVGEQIFAIPPAPITRKLPTKNEHREGGPLSQQLPPVGDEFAGRDFRGYAQFHTSYYRPNRAFIRDLFTLRPEVQQRMTPAAIRLEALGKTPVGIHLRRGDYGRLHFYITPVRWYLDWLAEHWPKLDNPVLFVAAEDRRLVNEFRKFNPQTAESLGVCLDTEPMPTYSYLKHDLKTREPHLLDFFPDWYLLTRCEYLLIPNSTYSFVAAMLSRRLRHCFRSDLNTQRFVEIDPWDTDPLTHEQAEDFKHIPGVCLDSNPQW